MKLKFKIAFMLLLAAGVGAGFFACQSDLDNELATDSLGENELAISQLAASESVGGQEYSPLNVVPEWVKEKVSPEEYELWKTLSSRYEIDYSFLKKEISPQRMENIISYVEQLCEEMKQEQCEWDSIPFRFLVPSSFYEDSYLTKIERLSNPEAAGWYPVIEHFSSFWESKLVRAHVDVTISYEVDPATKQIRNLTSSYDVISMEEGLKSSFSGTVLATQNGDGIIVLLKGTIYYSVDGKFVKQPESVFAQTKMPINYNP